MMGAQSTPRDLAMQDALRPEARAVVEAEAIRVA